MTDNDMKRMFNILTKYFFNLRVFLFSVVSTLPLIYYRQIGTEHSSTNLLPTNRKCERQIEGRLGMVYGMLSLMTQCSKLHSEKVI